MSKSLDYSFLLRSPTVDKWRRIGIRRRAGVAVPLFSIYSSESIGIGEIPDLKLAVDWCKKAGMSILQLLPLNEVGYGFSPYDSISTFALEPIYLRISELKNVDIDSFSHDIDRLKECFSKNDPRVNYEIKHAKLEILRRIFNSANSKARDELDHFVSENKYWMRDYALYKVIREKNSFESWEQWQKRLSNHDRNVLKILEKKNASEIQFQYWLQWQLYEQLTEIKKYAGQNGVLIMGDMPFLVSRDSADVWSHQNYFKLSYSAGAPHDMYFALGQKWGTPPYNWSNIRKDKFKYIEERLKYAQNFYDMYRIDHFVGLFRVWTFPLYSKGGAGSGRQELDGKFDPDKVRTWQRHGKKIINAMLRSSHMLPCAEDLGTVPECSFKTLHEYGIPGTDFQRFLKNKKDYSFVKSQKYRKHSSAVISTHDSSFFINWWNYEAGTVDEKLFELTCIKAGLSGRNIGELKKELFDRKRSIHGRLYCIQNLKKAKKTFGSFGINKMDLKKLMAIYIKAYDEKRKFVKYLNYSDKVDPKANFRLFEKCFEIISGSASIFSIQLLHELMYLDRGLFGKVNNWSYRINQPGIMDSRNWTLRIPLSLEELIESKTGRRITGTIKRINKKSNRI
jgi:4-alpha-glucanotransferase